MFNSTWQTVLLPIAQAVPAENAPWLRGVLELLFILVVPFVIGHFAAKSLRMPDYSWKIGLILFAIAFGVDRVYFGTLKLGIDLAGGVILVYEVDQTQKSTAEDVEMDKMVAAVRRRVDPAGVKELTIRPYGEEQIEVIIPEVDSDEIELIKKKISSAGLLEFRITANEVDHAELIRVARAQPNSREPSGGGLQGRWVELGENMPPDGLVTRTAPQGPQEVLMVIDELNVTGAFLDRARSDIDERGRPSVSFTLNSEGGILFSALTRENQPDASTGHYRRLGIILDNQLLSAPRLETTISTQGSINGDFTDADIEFLVGILNAGSLPAALNPVPISEQKISPTLGEDTISQGKTSMLVASGAVLVFMAGYYWFAGIVACFVLFLNLLLVVALMITVQAAFTLPGLAGLVLTIGMAVDANVLIFERMREERDRGAALRMAIRNGFDKATRTIIDANITTMIVAIVLYTIGTDQIRGFSVTLILGILLSMFTAIFVARMIFEIAERRRWITTLPMMRMLSKPNFNFSKGYRPAMALSAIVILVGLGAVVTRGRNLLDIDFTGGYSVHVLFAENNPQDITDVRGQLEGKLSNYTVVAVGDDNLEFKIDTAFDDSSSQLSQEQRIDQVRQILKGAFAGQLRRNEVTVGDPTRIATNRGLPYSSTDIPLEDAGPPATTSDGYPLLAMADTDAVFLAQNADSDQEPVDPAATDIPAPTADDDGVTQPENGDTAETTEVSPDATAETEDEADPFKDGSEVSLKFSEQTKHDTLADRIARAFETAGIEDVRFELTADDPQYTDGSGVPYTDWELRIALDPDQTATLLSAVKSEVDGEVVFPSSSTIGSVVAGNTRAQALVALLVSLVGIIIYIWVRFQNVTWGLASVAALVHDVLTILAALALSLYVARYIPPVSTALMMEPFKIGLTTIAAFLTIIGYSINDTIVIFDRMREVKGKSPALTEEMINASLNQTLSRTIITAGTSLIVVLILYIMGGQAIHGFAFALTIGIITGTYSSLFIAAPLVLWMENARREGKTHRRAAA